jgi:hypothetical protein
MKKIRILLTLIIGSLLLIACGSGGGGGGGDDVAPAKSAATLTAANATQTADALSQAFYLTELSDLLGESIIVPASTSVELKPKGVLYTSLNKVISISKNQIINDGQVKALGTLPPTTEGRDSGSVTISATWDGPNNPTHTSQIINLNATATFRSCREGTSTLNGTVTLLLTGPADNPTRLTFSSSSLTVTDSATGDNITMSNLSLVITDTKMTLSGALSGTADGYAINEEYDNLTIEASSGAGGDTISISGTMKPSCLDGWITINTNINIFVATGADCPSAGEVIITSAGNSVKVVMGSDSSIKVYFNDALEETYGDCSELEEICYKLIT